MKAVWDACKAAGIPIPREVDVFFDGVAPDQKGVKIDEDVLADAGALRPWSDQHREGYEVLVANLPKDVTVIRVYNAW